MKVYLGYDKSEHAAYSVAYGSLRMHSNVTCEPLYSPKLYSQGLLTRQVDLRNDQPYDFPSNAPCSTEFSNSRFLVPIICQSQWALFVDCDVIFYADVMELMAFADPDKAVMVVKHEHVGKGEKMGGLAQTDYPRKNWSSVMLFNCDHPSNRRLSLWDVNNRPGRELHRFYWLDDSEIGELPARWNWLVNEMQMPKDPKIAHFTMGGPWIKDWETQKNDSLWKAAALDLGVSY